MPSPASHFLEVEFPERVLVEALTACGGWVLHGEYLGSEFGRNEDGAYVNTMNGSPMWIRCLRRDGDIVYCVDGAGTPFVYRLRAAGVLGEVSARPPAGFD